jgi:predicted nucleotide-binding protein
VRSTQVTKLLSEFLSATSLSTDGGNTRQSKQSQKAERLNYYYQWQFLKPSGKRKARTSFTISVKILNGAEENAASKGTTRMACRLGSVR